MMIGDTVCVVVSRFVLGCIDADDSQRQDHHYDIIFSHQETDQSERPPHCHAYGYYAVPYY